MKTDTSRKSVRVNFACSEYFKTQLAEEAARRDMSLTELLKISVREYIRQTPHDNRSHNQSYQG
jgi:hypothetical protein